MYHLFKYGIMSKTNKRILMTYKLKKAAKHIMFFTFDVYLFYKGVGLGEFAAKLIAVGAKYGNIPAADVLPSARTVSRHVHDVVAREKSTLKNELQNVKRFGVTTDGWTHEGTTTPYITVTLHNINEVPTSIVTIGTCFDRHWAIALSGYLRYCLLCK